MTTPSTRYGLALPTQTDKFSTSDIRENWEKLDAAPGIFLCQSNDRPAWTAAQAGRTILELNTGLEWTWSGNSWVRLSGGRGVLRRTNGTPAIGERTNNFSTTSDDFVKVVSVTSVVIPAGGLPIMVMGIWPQADNSQGHFITAIYRSDTSNSGPKLSSANIGAYDGQGAGGQIIGFERGGLAAGTYDFSLQIKCAPVGGTSWMYATGTQPIQIVIIEL